jgi:hypothetical protein
MMDKNKSMYKLEGIPEIYYINLDDKVDRKEYMENQFEYWGIEKYTRISACDGREDDLSSIIKGRYPENVISGEIGCVTSHLKLLKHWLENSDEQVLLVMEDDCDLDTVKYWPFSWKDFYRQVPYDFDVIQLAIINPQAITLRMHKRFVNDFSTACYMITRHHAEKLVRMHCRDDKFKLDQGIKPRAVADDLVYNAGNTFAMPLFMYKIDLGSDIHDIHIEVFHRSSYNALWGFWKQTAATIDNWNELFEYDPFLGRLPPQSS